MERIRFANYDEMSDLDLEQLFEIVARGDTQERLWATWALGVRLDQRIIPLLNRRWRIEPSSGARRHVVVMLAGFCGIEAALEIGSRDTHDRVRATALKYVALLAEPNDAFAYDLIAHRMLNERTIPRLALIESLRLDAPDDILSTFHMLARDENIDIRTAVIERIILEQATFGDRFQGLLRRRARDEKDSRIGRRIIRYLLSRGEVLPEVCPDPSFVSLQYPLLVTG